MNLGLQGKTAIVTGGSKGIGFATAMALAAEGAKVALVARGLEALQKAAEQIAAQTGQEPLVFAADVSEEQDVRMAVEKTVERFGSVDILVNNAGTSAARPFEEVSQDMWEADLDLKLFGAVHFSRAAVPYMRQNGGGAILNVTAVGGKGNHIPGIRCCFLRHRYFGEH